MIRPNQTKKSSERGVAMVMALLALLLLTTVVAGMLMTSNGEISTNANFRDEQTALLASKSGLEEVRDRLRTNAPDSLKPSLPTTLPGSANGILYVTNAAAGETVAPWNTLASNYPDTEICNEVSCTSGIPAGTPWYFGPQLASNSYAASPQLPWKWVRVMQKKNKDAAATRMTSVDGTAQGQRVCWNGTSEVITTQATCQAANTAYQPVYELTALSVTSNGSRRMTQYEVVSTSFPPPPGAMVFDGPGPTYNAPNSNVFTVSGNDANQGPNAGVGCGTPTNQPAIGAFNGAAQGTLSTGLPRPANYTGTGGTPSVVDVSPQLGPFSTVDGLQKLVNQVTAAADPANLYVGAASGLTNPGTNSNPVINVVQGDLSLGGGFSGAGILLVTGTLTMSGNPNYNGIILVIGKGVFVKNGGGNGTMNGSIVVANMNDVNGVPIPLGYNNPPGSPSISWNGGGNATIQYDTCWINALTQSFTYRVLAQRELVY